MPETDLNCIFSTGCGTAFLHLGTVDSTSPLHAGTVLNREITNERHRNAKGGPKETAKRTLVSSLRAETKVEHCLVQPQLGTCVAFLPTLERWQKSQHTCLLKRTPLSYSSITSELIRPQHVPHCTVGAGSKPLESESETAEIFISDS